MSGADGEITVIHVDTHQAFAELTQLYVERLDDRMSVVTASDAAEALEFLDRLDVDCIVSEYVLSDTEGTALLEAVRERGSSVPFVLFTTRHRQMVARATLTDDLTAFLQKRTDTEQFEDLVTVIDDVVATGPADELLRSGDGSRMDAD